MPLLVLAERQTAGRGRGTHRWWSTPGSLTFSLLLDLCRQQVPADRQPLLSILAGLAVCEAIELLLPNLAAGLKWPNDVFLAERKVSGVLIEAPARPAGRLVVGVGLNVNNSFAAAPEELQHTVTALCDVAQREFDRAEVLICVLQRFADLLEMAQRDPAELPSRWRTRSLLSGRPVLVEAGSRAIRGVCRGIDDQGALLLETASGIERCLSGTVRLEPQRQAQRGTGTSAGLPLGWTG
jgi:BirA family biotin operon repressor/biotin-[acetyl-CoA-carboxylase] ligase